MMRLTKPSALLALTLLAACSTAGPPSALPEPRPLGQGNAWRPGDEVGQIASTDIDLEPHGVLDLPFVLAASLVGNPELAAASHSVRAAEAEALQAGLPPNPSIGIEVENFGGEGELSGFDGSEFSLGVSQEILMGGKLASRETAARLRGELVGWEYESARLFVLTAAAKAFVAVLAGQQRVAVLEEAVRLSEEAARSVREQVAAGKVARLEASRAEVVLALRRLAHTRAIRKLASLRQDLCGSWGGAVAGFDRVEGDLFAIRPVPSLEALSALLVENPELARRAVETELARAGLSSAEARAVPDLTVVGGVRRINEGDLTAFFAGIEFPLPLFDRNQGGIRAARAEADRVAKMQRAAAVRLNIELHDAWQTLTAAASEAEILKSRVLPLAEEAFDAAGEGFRRGKFGYLEVLDAQRTLFDTKEQLVDALAAYHTAVADVESLIGRSLSAVGDE